MNEFYVSTALGADKRSSSESRFSQDFQDSQDMRSHVKNHVNLFNHIKITVQTMALLAFLLCSAGSAFAQCSNVSLTLTPTAATCFNNGSIMVEIRGADLDNLNLDNCEFRVIPWSITGTMLNWTQWMGVGAFKLSPGIAPDQYTVEFRAFCKDNTSGVWDVVGVSATTWVTSTYAPPTFNVSSTAPTSCTPSNGRITCTFSGGKAPYTVYIISAPSTYNGNTTFTPTPTSSSLSITSLPPGSYTLQFTDNCTYSIPRTVSVGPPEATDFTLTNTRKTMSMSCHNTGQIRVSNLTGGSPYTIKITNAPPGYTGTTTFSTSATSLDLKGDYPAGSYTITVSSSCGSMVHSVTVNTLSSDTPTFSSLYAQNYNADCQTVSVNTSASSDWSPYSSGGWYEYDISVGTTPPGTQNWKSTNSISGMSFQLPVNYADFCASGDQLWLYLRPVGCTSEQGYLINKSTYLCPSNIFTVGLLDNACTTAGLQITIDSRYALCYPLSYSVTPLDSPTDTIDSGIVNNSGTNLTPSSAKYNKGTKYVISLKESGANGRTFTQPFEPPPPGLSWQAFTVRENNTATTCYTSIEIEQTALTSPTNIAPGTKITYLSGPDNFVLKMGAPGDSIEIPEGYNLRYFYPNTTSSSYGTNTNNEQIPRGTYNFRIEDACGTILMRSVSIGQYVPQDFTYTLSAPLPSPNCGKRQFTPTGRITYINGAGTTTNVTTYYRIIAGPPGYSTGYATWNTNNSFTNLQFLMLPSPGVYTIQMSRFTNFQCATTTQVEYSGLYFDANTFAYYICEDSDSGYVYIEGINGIPPYTYTIFDAGTTNTLASNQTGKFMPFGVADTLYDIKIQDACGVSMTFPNIKLLDLTTAELTYTVNNGVFCPGEMVQLNVIALGDESEFEWTYPDGTKSTERQPRFPAVYPDHSGTYYVRVKPEACPEYKLDSLVITILDDYVPPPTVSNTSLTLCFETGIVNVALLVDVIADEDHVLIWYAGDNVTPIAPPTEVSTDDSIGVIKFYVAQKGGVCAFESEHILIEVKIEDDGCGHIVTYQSGTGNGSDYTTKGDIGYTILSPVATGFTPQTDMIFLYWKNPTTNRLYYPGDIINITQDTLFVAYWSDVWEIWNWDDLSKVMEKQDEGFTHFRVMQNIGTPNGVFDGTTNPNYGNGSDGASGSGVAGKFSPYYNHPDADSLRKYGWYGYEGYEGIGGFVAGTQTETKHGWMKDEGWIPIGYYITGHIVTGVPPYYSSTDYHEEKPFTGVFDGQRFAVSGLWIDRPYDEAAANDYSSDFQDRSDYQGLFGYVQGADETEPAVIKNLGINILDMVKGHNAIGGLVGWADGAKISNCYTTGTVSGETKIGGLAGEMNYTDMSDCYATGDITAKVVSSNTNTSSNYTYKNGFIGGLVGCVDLENSITNCYASGAVTAEVVGSNYGVGNYSYYKIGLIGGLVGGMNSENSITTSYATGAVTAEIGSSYYGNYYNEYIGLIGGLVGDMTSNNEITNSYASGAVTAKVVYNNYNTSYGFSSLGLIGGLVGNMESDNNITNCYASGAVTEETVYRDNTSNYYYQSTSGFIGGLVGTMGSYNSITNSYASGIVMAEVDGIGTISGFIGGLVGCGGYQSEIAHCFALNPAIMISQLVTSFGRILGGCMDSYCTSLADNYALECMLVKNKPVASGDKDNKDGENIVLDALIQTPGNETTYSGRGWDFGNIWTFDYDARHINVTAMTNLPVLQAFNDTDFPNALQQPYTECRTIDTFQIWNWADLAYLNTLISIPHSYGVFMLMQDLVRPGEEDDGYGDGTAGGADRLTPCPYNEPARRKSGYGYQNYNPIAPTLDDYAGDKEIFTGDGLIVGESGIPLPDVGTISGWNEDGWLPIGYYTYFWNYEERPFIGIFDGQGFAVSGLWIDRTADDGSGDNQGLFGYVQGDYYWDDDSGEDIYISPAVIKNLGVNILGAVKGYWGVGGLVGYAQCLEISNCYATGAVSGDRSVGGLVGGIEGWEDIRAVITDCYATGAVNGTGQVGGLIGSGIAENSKITNCYATGDVVAKDNGEHIGGLVGDVYGMEITNCYASGDVTLEDEQAFGIGGLVGHYTNGNDNKTITNCYATGDVDVTSNEYAQYIGGLVGGIDSYNDEICTVITNCYASGDVTVEGRYTFDIGGLVGYVYGMEITNCYASGTVAVEGGEFCENIGGLMGSFENGTIAHCFALNPEIRISGTVTDIGRIVGSYSVSSSDRFDLADNYALECMVVRNRLVSGTKDNKQGASIAWENLIQAPGNEATYSGNGWNFGNIWTFDYDARHMNVTAMTNLPVLQAFNTTIMDGFFADALQPPYTDCSAVDTFQIWNWADLAYLNTMIVNQYDYDQDPGNYGSDPKLDDYAIYILMQNLVVPGDEDDYSNGTHGGADRTAVCLYEPEERRYSGYGYQNYDPDANTYTPGNKTPFLGSGLIVGESGISLPDVKTVAGWNDEGWLPIGLYDYNSWEEKPFNGIFDGQGFAVNGLWIDRRTNYEYGNGDYLGLFGRVQGTEDIGYSVIKNLGVNILDTVKGGAEVGGLVGYAEYLEISNCYATGAVSGQGDVGGLVGHMEIGAISNCYATGDVTGEDGGLSIGGLAGTVGTGSYEGGSTSITNCYATGDVVVKGEGYSTGGLVGSIAVYWDGVTATITNSYASGTVAVEGENANSVGGLVGYGYNVTIAHCFALNPEIIVPAIATNVGRIISDPGGYWDWNELSDNYALGCMLVNHRFFAGTKDSKNGANIAWENLIQAPGNETTYSSKGWDFGDIWTFDYEFGAGDYKVAETTNLPILQIFNTTDFPDALQKPYTECRAVDTFQIWNWADLAYLNTLIANQYDYDQDPESYVDVPKLTDYGIFVLMQNLGMPDSIGTYGTGTGGADGTAICPYDPPRNQGWYGFQNYDPDADIYTPGDKTPFLGSGLLVGESGILLPGARTVAGWDENGWIPIGNDYYDPKPFLGVFDGQGFSISGLWIDRVVDYFDSYDGSADNQGLFGYVGYNETMCAAIKNLGVNILDTVRGTQYVGGLVGYTQYSEISNCYTTGVVSGQNYIGGLVGSMGNGTITNSYTSGDVTGDVYCYYSDYWEKEYCDKGNTIGGLVGLMATGVITNSYATGNVNGEDYLGGLVGLAYHNTEIVNCYATGDVVAVEVSYAYIGGLVGSTEGPESSGWKVKISNCYTTGDVIAIMIEDEDYLYYAVYAGGLVGIAYNGDITHCYATGNIVVEGEGEYAEGGIGGLVGVIYGGYGEISTITHCFALNSEIRVPSSATEVGRISGNDYLFWEMASGSELSDNYALECMFINHRTISDGTADNKDGASLPFESLVRASGNEATYSGNGWDFGDVWTFDYDARHINVTENTNLPVLQAFDTTIMDGFFVHALQPPYLECKPMDTFYIWNWADLAYLNTLIANQQDYDEDAESYSGDPKLTDYDIYALMQNLVIPGTEDEHSNGTQGGADRSTECPYLQEERWYSGYGYQNYDSISLDNWLGDKTIFGGLGLIVGESEISLFDSGTPTGWDDGGWIPIGSEAVGSQFSRMFDGQGFAVTGLWMDRTADDGSGDNQGLFGYVQGLSEALSATIRNLGVNILDTVKGYAAVGGLAGSAQYLNISNCYTTGTVSGEIEVGGLVGDAEYMKISNSYSTGNVVAENDGESIGGLVGNMEETTISNSYASGKVTVRGEGNMMGGIAGQVGENSKIAHCFALNPEIVLSVATNFGRIVGYYDFEGEIELVDNYALACMLVNNKTVAGGITSNMHGADIAFSELVQDPPSNANADTYSSKGWDFGDTWTFDYEFGAGDYNVTAQTNLPILQAFGETGALQPPYTQCKEIDTFRIWNWADLAYLHILIENEYGASPLLGDQTKLRDYNAFKLMQDLGIPDSIGTYGTGTGGANGTTLCPYPPPRNQGWYGYENWNGAEGGTTFNHKDFYGGSDLVVGEAGTIKILASELKTTAGWDEDGWIPIGYLNIAYGPYHPFFGTFDGQGFAITGLWMNRENTDEFIARDDTEGLFGYIENTSIKNLGVNIIDTVQGTWYTGGLAGLAHFSNMTNCYVTGTVMGEARVGGLTGRSIDLILNDCYAAVTVTGYEDGGSWNGNEIGGLVGTFLGDGSITNCYTTGSVKGNIMLGGLTGLMGPWDIESTSAITDCYSASTVHGFEKIGGLVGYNEVMLTIASSYAAGNLTAEDYGNEIGGLVGSGKELTITNCFALIQHITALYATDIGRILGYDEEENANLSNNYALACMLINDDPAPEDDGTGNNGLDVALSAVVQSPLNAATYTVNGWNFGNVWTFNYDFANQSVYRVTETTNLPILQAFNTTAFPKTGTAVQPPLIIKATVELKYNDNIIPICGATDNVTEAYLENYFNFTEDATLHYYSDADRTNEIVFPFTIVADADTTLYVTAMLGNCPDADNVVVIVKGIADATINLSANPIPACEAADNVTETLLESYLNVTAGATIYYYKDASQIEEIVFPFTLAVGADTTLFVMAILGNCESGLEEIPIRGYTQPELEVKDSTVCSGTEITLEHLVVSKTFDAITEFYEADGITLIEESNRVFTTIGDNILWAKVVLGDCESALEKITVRVNDLYFVAYHANGGGGVPLPDTTYYCPDETASVFYNNSFGRANFKFLGWALSDTASAPYYVLIGNSYFPSNSFTVDHDYNLYAIWEKACNDRFTGSIAIVSRPSCSDSTGSIYVDITGGVGPYYYDISNDNGYEYYDVFPDNGIITGLPTGNYTLMITDDGNDDCENVLPPFSLVSDDVLTVVTGITTTPAGSCGGNGAVHVTVAGATDYTYRIRNINTGNVISVTTPATGLSFTYSPLPEGEYELTLYDDLNNCAGAGGRFTIGVAKGIFPTFTLTEVPGNCTNPDGFIAIKIPTAINTDTCYYSLDNGIWTELVGDSIAIAATVGIHSIRMMTNAGCISIADTITLTQDNDNAFTTKVTGTTSTNCGSNNGSIYLKVSSAGKYNYHLTTPSFDLAGDFETESDGTYRITNLPAGLYVVTIDNEGYETGSDCAYHFTNDNVEVRQGIVSIIAAPSATTPQTFCGGATIANLQVDGTGIKWYNAAGAPMSSSDPVLHDSIYYASQTTTGGCESVKRTAVKVILDTIIIATPSVPSEVTLCTPATLEDIPTDGNTNIVWYDAPTGGSVVLPGTGLTEETTLYATLKAGSCESVQLKAVHIVIVSTPPDPPTMESPQHFCDGALVANLATPNNQILWYDANNNLLPDDTKLVTGTYFAIQKAGSCQSATSTPVNVVIDRYSAPVAPAAQTLCGGKIKTVSDLTITGAGIKWYDKDYQLITNPSTATLTAGDSLFATQSTGDCEGDSIIIRITKDCFSPYGTVFPFVHTDNPTYDSLFTTTAKLYALPPAAAADKIGYVRKQTPLYMETVTFYDYRFDTIPEAPKIPGIMGNTDNPGLPIRWIFNGYPDSDPPNETTLAQAGDNEPTATIGKYRFKDVAPGQYVIEIARKGFLTRYGLITVTGSDYLGHREILAGDINGDLVIDGKDLSTIRQSIAAQGTSLYNYVYDFHGLFSVTASDVRLIQVNLNFHFDVYQEAKDWANP